MRIVSGKFKGRKILGFNINGTRPTMDRVRESVFAMIQDYLKDSSVLDLFAGTGAYGIEAISNGSSFVCFNDYNKKCVNIIKDNINNLNINNQVLVLNYDYLKCLNYIKNNNYQFNIIFLDPPYKYNVFYDIINYIIENNILKINGLIIIESLNEIIIDNKYIKQFKIRKYGSKYIIIYQRIGE